MKGLSKAWREAEAELPEGRFIMHLTIQRDDADVFRPTITWMVYVGGIVEDGDIVGVQGADPVAALKGLAQELRKRRDAA